MLQESFSDFDWDEGNSRKNLFKHGFTCEEIEAVFRRGLRWGHDPDHSNEEERFLGRGYDDRGRVVAVAFTFRLIDGKRHVRPISVRYMHRKEVERHE